MTDKLILDWLSRTEHRLTEIRSFAPDETAGWSYQVIVNGKALRGRPNDSLRKIIREQMRWEKTT